MSYQGGLRKWHKEKWTDIKTGEECGRSSASDTKRPYPACRPKKTAQSMSASDKRKVKVKKKSKERVNWPVSPSGKKKSN